MLKVLLEKLPIESPPKTVLKLDQSADLINCWAMSLPDLIEWITTYVKPEYKDHIRLLYESPAAFFETYCLGKDKTQWPHLADMLKRR